VWNVDEETAALSIETTKLSRRIDADIVVRFPALLKCRHIHRRRALLTMFDLELHILALG